MKNINVLQADKSQIVKSQFHDAYSYRTFIKGLKLLQKIQSLREQGYVIFHKGDMINEDFVLSLDEHPSLGQGGDMHIYGWLGYSYDEEGRTWIEEQDLTIFEDISYVKPTAIKKMKGLK